MKKKADKIEIIIKIRKTFSISKRTINLCLVLILFLCALVASNCSLETLADLIRLLLSNVMS